jgi:hypothetical protein
MDENYYQYERPISEIRYNFKSVSYEKEVCKRVIFTTSNYQNFYNLALVDVFEDGTVSDITETRNKDMITVLATVIKIIEEFLSQYPKSFIIFQGSDERRQRLYRLIINKEMPNIQKKFIVLGGFDESQPEPFQTNQQYDYFIISKIR